MNFNEYVINNLDIGICVKNKELMLGFGIRYLIEHNQLYEWSNVSDKIIDCFDDAYEDVMRKIKEYEAKQKDS